MPIFSTWFTLICTTSQKVRTTCTRQKKKPFHRLLITTFTEFRTFLRINVYSIHCIHTVPAAYTSSGTSHYNHAVIIAIDGGQKFRVLNDICNSDFLIISRDKYTLKKVLPATGNWKFLFNLRPSCLVWIHPFASEHYFCYHNYYFSFYVEESSCLTIMATELRCSICDTLRLATGETWLQKTFDARFSTAESYVPTSRGGDSRRSRPRAVFRRRVIFTNFVRNFSRRTHTNHVSIMW